MTSLTYTFHICLGVFIMLANSTSIHVLRKENLGLSKITVFLLINLAVADLMFGATVATRALLFQIGTTSFHGCLTLISVLDTSVVITFCTSIITSVYNLYNCQGKLMNIKKNYKVIVALQAVSWVLSFVVGFVLSIAPNHVPITSCSLTDDMINKKSVLFVAIWWLASVVALIVLQVCTAIRLRKIQNTSVGPLENNPSGSSSGTGDQTIQTRNAKQFRKSVLLFSFIAGLIIVCWCPFVVAAILKVALPQATEVDTILPYFALLFVFNSAMNFFIYLVRMKRFRAALWKSIICTK